MKLFSLALSPFAARVRVAVHAKKLPVEIVSPPSDWRTAGIQEVEPARAYSRLNAR